MNSRSPRSNSQGRCADCVSISEIDWNAGVTNLSGQCMASGQRIINHKGGRGGLYQKRNCWCFEPSNSPDQQQKVRRKIFEGKLAALHSSYVTVPSQATSVGSLELRPAGARENRLTAPSKALEPQPNSVTEEQLGCGHGSGSLRTLEKTSKTLAPKPLIPDLIMEVLADGKWQTLNEMSTQPLLRNVALNKIGLGLSVLGEYDFVELNQKPQALPVLEARLHPSTHCFIQNIRRIEVA